MSGSRADILRTVEAIWRIESARVVATLARYSGDLGSAEDLAQDAVLAAIEQWPASGIPDKPGAWLVRVGKRRMIDTIRRRSALDIRQEELLQAARNREHESEDEFAEAEEEVADDKLRLVFVACHPVLAPEARAALTLRVVGGLTTVEIARAYLAKESTIAQRIVRAKRVLSAAAVPFELPAPDELAGRLTSVLEVLYLIFNEGYVATEGPTWTRPDLCYEALRLARMLSALMPREPEVQGLAALMEIQASRLGARVGPGGRAVLLSDQDRTRWDPILIRRGLSALDRAVGLGRGLGPYGLQAAIAAVHAQARTLADTNWIRIAALYEALAALQPSPVVRLNQAVALAKAYGPDTGLRALEQVSDEPAIQHYYLYFAVRGELLDAVGRHEGARPAFRQAASHTRNDPERQLLQQKADLPTGSGLLASRRDNMPLNGPTV